MKKRILALLLAALFVLTSVMSGCGEETQAPTAESQKETEQGSQQETEEPSSSAQEDYSAYEYGEIDYDADITGIDRSLFEKPMSEIDRATLEYAIQQVCLAYYYKGANTQYDLGRQCYDAKADAYRRTTGQSPEDTDWDSNWYSQCAEYCYDVYWELCNYEYINCGTIRSTRDDFKKESNSIAYTYGTWGWDKAKIDQMILYDARPGDIFHSNGSTGGGHLIMILGDVDGDGENDCCHCWPYGGGTMRLPVDSDTDTEFVSGAAGDQKWDKYGVVFQSARELIINTTKTNGMPLWSVYSTNSDKTWQVYRPFEQSDIGNYHLTPSSVTRITYEGIDVTKTPDCSVHQSICQGDDIVITIVIKNHGKEDFKGLNVTEYVPNGTVFKAADNGGKNDGRKIQWTVDVPAGGEITFTYTVTNMYGAGKEVEIPAGLVAGLKTRTCILQVGASKFTDEQLNAMKKIGADGKLPKDIEWKKTNELDFVNTFYKEILGKELNLPSSTNDLMAGIVEEQKSIKGSTKQKMLFRKTDITGYEDLNRMIVRNQIGGYCYSTGSYPGVANFKISRILDIKEAYWMPGDIFIAYDGKNSMNSLTTTADLKIYIYLGDGKVAARIGTGSGVMDYEQTIDLLLSMNFAVVLRPNLVY